MKRVGFEVSKALKEAGYPQDETEYKYTKEGNIFVPKNRGEDEKYSECDAPYVMEVWLWLWNKGFEIPVFNRKGGGASCVFGGTNGIVVKQGNAPEEAIEAAIEYVVKNNLIK